MRRHVRVISHSRPAASQIEQMTQLVGLISAIIGTFQNAVYLVRDLKKDTQS